MVYMEALVEITKLVERYQQNLDSYRSASYNETQLRQEFINPFFEALGWDVANKDDHAEAYKPVIHEDAIKVGGATKAPDYCFRIGGIRKFFVETKRPSINIKEDIDSAYQLRRYAWSAKLPLSILTNFHEFVIYDCRIKPNQNDPASTARFRRIEYQEYSTRWGEIASVFAKEAVLKGLFDKYAESGKGKRGTAEVDAAFLREIESWRDLLARNIAIRNPDLNHRQMNFAVQRTVDRVIFLRICEDRGIETYGQLQSLMNGTNIYRRLCAIFLNADDKYNSGLFHFEKEKDIVEPPDELTLNLSIDDKVIKEIIGSLYYPNSPYVFSVLPADILGQVYEQFLGKVIRLTAGHQAKVEEKPEVRKAGGVYYTPTYIVDYIVKNTVGKLLEKKTPNQATKLRILDPACGSGSFLIGAYQYLLDWHRDWYEKHEREKWTKGRNPRVYQASGREWKLTISERKRILLNNIYGVDIDSQAVEVTKLSLLLKVLEGANQQTIERMLKLFHERALPDLGSNIKCGNSLIGPDFYEGKQTSLFDEEEMYRINAFDWGKEFPEIITSRNVGTEGAKEEEDLSAAGGFDAVIGNPPYVFGRDWRALKIGDNIKDYFRNTYKASPYQLDMYSIFIEKASMLCRFDGRIGQIVPNAWLTNTFSWKTRSFVISHAIDLAFGVPLQNVFPQQTVDTIVYTMLKAENDGSLFQLREIGPVKTIELFTYETEKYIDGRRPISTVADNKSSDLVERIKLRYPGLETVAEITRGVHCYRKGGYGRTAYGTGPQTQQDIDERPYHSKIGGKGYRTFVFGRDLGRFCSLQYTEYVRYGPWLAEPRDPKFFKGERVYSRKILSDRLMATLEITDSIADQQVYITRPVAEKINARYLLGILSSRFISFFIRSYFDEATKAFPQIKVTQLKSIPIPPIKFSNHEDKYHHDSLVALVERMLELHKMLAAAKTEHEKTLLQRQIETTDQQIDRLVYELYGLTEEEIKIVEGR